jgi:GTP-binding protein HflX
MHTESTTHTNDLILNFTRPVKDVAILVGVGEQYGKSDELVHYDPLGELRLLADTAGAEVVGTLIQTRHPSDPAFYIGKGKVEELMGEVERLEANTVIFDNDLSPVQASNLEKHLNVKVIDRSGLILDIFALRAKTREAKVQVELAQLKYLLPRLTRRWTHLSHQNGGIGTRGPGETQLEIDRRRVRDRIAHLAGILKAIEKQRAVSRRKRKERFKIALVGYTNTGKSTLLNALSGADVPVEDKLFKTLDSVTRLVKSPDAPEMLISDTVGFIRNLPHHLVASFTSTLSEVRDADALIHVVDISNPEWEEQIRVVNTVLHDLGVLEKPILLVFNKIDRTENLVSPGVLARFSNAFPVSASRGTGLEALKEALKHIALTGRRTFVMEFGPNRADLLREVYRAAVIHKTEGIGDSIRLSFTMPESLARKLKLIPESQGESEKHLTVGE